MHRFELFSKNIEIRRATFRSPAWRARAPLRRGGGKAAFGVWNGGLAELVPPSGSWPLNGFVRHRPLSMLLVACLMCGAVQPLLAQGANDRPSLRYHDLRTLGVEGKGWTDTAQPYDRLPARAEASVRSPVWGLSHHSAGLCARFVTDATELTVRWVLTSANLAMPHMPATGVSGVDLYVRQTSGAWRWVANGRPTGVTNAVRLFQGLSSELREFRLYLPLYNGVSSVELGLSDEATLSRAPERPAPRQRPLLFYGTSITQGGCASRPGMVHTAIVGRALDREVINLGFSGNGRMEPEMAELVAEIHAEVFILDCVPNMDAEMIRERVEPFVRQLRRAHPDTPILLVEDRTYADAFFKPARRDRNRENRAALKEVFARLQANGLKALHYLPGDELLGEDGEDTVDGSHPTDLGFARQASAFLRALKALVAKPDPLRVPSASVLKERMKHELTVPARTTWFSCPKSRAIE